MSGYYHGFEPLPAGEVVKAVERRSPSRIPLVQAKWWGEGLHEQYGSRLKEFDAYPDDAPVLSIEMVVPERMGLSWKLPGTGTAHDSAAVIDDWAKLGEFIRKLPDPANDPQVEELIRRAEAVRQSGRYVMIGWWRLFFERPWGLRGMENLLADYYGAPAQVHDLHSALCDLYCRYLRIILPAVKPHGFWTSDDLGHQTNSMMSPEKFGELLLPYYRRVGAILREHNTHWWLHSCGNNAPLMDQLVQGGVDVFHPVQKGTMDERETVKRFGGKISFLAGIDVQHVLQEGSEEDVRREVRSLIDAFDLRDGGLCLAAGNGIVSGTPIGNIHAFLQEALEYGSQHRGRSEGDRRWEKGDR